MIDTDTGPHGSSSCQIAKPFMHNQKTYFCSNAKCDDATVVVGMKPEQLIFLIKRFPSTWLQVSRWFPLFHPGSYHTGGGFPELNINTGHVVPPTRVAGSFAEASTDLLSSPLSQFCDVHLSQLWPVSLSVFVWPPRFTSISVCCLS